MRGPAESDSRSFARAGGRDQYLRPFLLHEGLLPGVGLYLRTERSSIDCYSVQGVHSGRSEGKWLVELLIPIRN